MRLCGHVCLRLRVYVFTFLCLRVSVWCLYVCFVFDCVSVYVLRCVSGSGHPSAPICLPLYEGGVFSHCMGPRTV